MVTYGVIALSRLPGRIFRTRHRRMSALAMAGLVWLSSGVSSSLSAAETASIDRDAFLRAIAQVETGGNSRAVGRRGERGMYQFGRTTWRQYTRLPHTDAHNPSIARTIAEKHFNWLYDGLVRNGRQPTSYMMAAAWNAGLTRALRGGLPSSTRSYATRVTNIVAAIAPQPRVVQVAQAEKETTEAALERIRSTPIPAATPADEPAPVIATSTFGVPRFLFSD